MLLCPAPSDYTPKTKRVRVTWLALVLLIEWNRSLLRAYGIHRKTVWNHPEGMYGIKPTRNTAFG